MDNAGWHAQRRAAHERSYYHADPPQRGPDGRYQPAEQIFPLDEQFIGGFHPSTPAPHGQHGLHPKGRVDGRPPPSPRPSEGTAETSTRTSQLTHLSAVERSQALRVARMQPHLQFMVGPLLRYDIVDERGIWNGAALIVTADSGSIYEPHPMLTYKWDPDAPLTSKSTKKLSAPNSPSGILFELGPHPADPHSTILPTAFEQEEVDGLAYKSPNAKSEVVPGNEIWVYPGNGGTFTFWRFNIQIPLGPFEMKIKYSINEGQELEFYVPGRFENMRWAAHSCNGFSAGVNPDEFRGPGFSTGYDPVWVDLLSKHAETPFHVLVGGGDQLYCDSLTREPEMQEWVAKMKPEERKTQPLTEEISFAIDRFYFNHYCKAFRSGAFARANSSIPMMNMCDDHDLIDGFGSYPDDLQNSPIFKTIGSRGYFFFLVFQCFINVEVDGIDDTPGKHLARSLIIGGPGSYVPFPSHSFLSSLGPQVSILLLDTRAERRKDQICSEVEYKKVFARLWNLPFTVEHLIVVIGVPIAYPRMVFLETALGSKFNPLVALGKSGSLGMSGFVNKFNADAELLDDLNDHWTAKDHKTERNWLILELQRLAKARRLRVSFLAGDVHCAAVGVLKTLSRGKLKAEVAPTLDYRYMINVVTSAIVNTPPPLAVIALVSSLATRNHKTLHHAETDESMIPIFAKDPDGVDRKQKFIMGRRNWCSIRHDAPSGEVVFDIRVEKEKGIGETVGYSVSAPKPMWIAGA